MIKRDYAQTKETLYTETLENGLKVYLLPENDFQKTYGLFTADYGSIDSTLVSIGQEEMIEVSDGITHLLEYKMFEKEDDDVFQKLGQQGASADVFTSSTKTSYLFSMTDQVTQNLETLLDFVQSPYFTKGTVEKEKGVIGQEIRMHSDDPNQRPSLGILGNFYPKHPLHIDIAGTMVSIAEITAEDLYTCYNAPYHPSNMTLFMVRKTDPEALMAFIRGSQATKEFPATQPIRRCFPEETAADIAKESVIEIAVVRAEVFVGLKDLDEAPATGRGLMKYQIAVDLLLQLSFGNISQNYLALYNEGLLGDNFSYDFNLDHSFHSADVGGDSERPEVLAERIEVILLPTTTSPESAEENLSLLKKEVIGRYFQPLDFLKYIANQLLQSSFGETTLFGKIKVIESIQSADVRQVVKTFIRKEGLSRFYMYSKGETERQTNCLRERKIFEIFQSCHPQLASFVVFLEDGNVFLGN